MTIAPEHDQEATLQSLIDAAAEHAPAQTKSGKARKAEIDAAINSGDIDELMGLQERMSTLMGKILSNKLDMENLGKMTDDEVESLMVEYFDVKEVQRLLNVRYAMERLAVFAHITELNKEKGVSDPEHTPGYAKVAKLGRKFTREGGKLKARIDQVKLRELVGDKVWAKITDTEVIPAVEEHVVSVFNEIKFMEHFKKNPAKAMAHLEASVIPGGYGTQSLHDREIKSDD